MKETFTLPYFESVPCAQTGANMILKVLEHDFSVCKIKDVSFVDWNQEFCFVGKTDEECSLVCLTEKVPFEVINQEDGWKAFRIQGILDFSMIGVLSTLTRILADQNIGVFVISTFHTDYVLTKKENFQSAIAALEDEGYEIEW